MFDCPVIIGQAVFPHLAITTTAVVLTALYSIVCRGSCAARCDLLVKIVWRSCRTSGRSVGHFKSYRKSALVSWTGGLFELSKFVHLWMETFEKHGDSVRSLSLGIVAMTPLNSDEQFDRTYLLYLLTRNRLRSEKRNGQKMMEIIITHFEDVSQKTVS